MLNIGLIGKISSLEKQVKELKSYADARIQGKSSVGTKTESTDTLYSIPEYNRIELIERSDAIFLEDSSLLPYDLIKDSIKRDKHIFFADYPDFSQQECLELIKLIDEAGTIVQVKNPFFFNPIVQWIKNNISAPFFIEINTSKKLQKEDQSFFQETIMMAITFAKKEPKKISPTFFNEANNQFNFQNVRFEYNDSSKTSLNHTVGNPTEEFNIKAITNNHYFVANLLKNTISSQNKSISLKSFKSPMEYESFFKSVNKKQASICGLNEYYTLLKTIGEVEKKKN